MPFFLVIVIVIVNYPTLADGYYGTLIGSHECRIRLYNFRWPWVTPNPGFKVIVYLEVEYLKTVHFRDKVTKEH